MKIACVIPTLHPGGMERVMSELTNYFVQFPNNEVHLILYGANPTIFYDINNSVVIHSLPVDNNISRVGKVLKSIFFLRKTIKTIQPQKVLSFGTIWNSFVLFSLFGVKTDIFISDRGNPTIKYSFLVELSRKLLYPRAKGIIAQTTIAAKEIERKYKHPNTAVIGNPINQQSKVNSIVREKIILSVGRLINSKHHDRLIKIFKELNAKEWKLIVVGGEALNQKNHFRLEKLVNDLGLENVILAGNQHDVASYYKRSSIFAFTSSSEGFPNVVGEALSFGLPVISYDCIAGPSEMIENDKNGFLVPVFDDTNFLEKLRLLIENEELRFQMSENAIKSIEKFSKNSIASDYLKFILNESSSN